MQVHEESYDEAVRRAGVVELPDTRRRGDPPGTPPPDSLGGRVEDRAAGGVIR